MFKTNEGNLDRGIRIIVGIVSLGFGLFILTGFLKVIALVVGVVALITGIIGFCGLYALLGINTCPVKK